MHLGWQANSLACSGTAERKNDTTCTKGMTSQGIIAFDTDDDCFKYLCELFPGLTLEKLKAGIFDGPQSMTKIEKAADFTSGVFSVNALGRNIRNTQLNANLCLKISEIQETTTDLFSNVNKYK